MIPGASVKITYDWDDINFSEILVETRSGSFKQLVVDPEPDSGQFHAPDYDTFVIPGLSQLPDAEYHIIEAGKGAEYNWGEWGAICSGLIPVILYLWWSRYRRMPSLRTLRPTHR